MSPSIEPLLDAEALRNGVAELGRRLAADLAADLGEEEPLIVAILGGSVIFLADLVRSIERPVRFELIQVGYSDPEGPSGVLDIQFPIPLEIAGQHLVLLKDVVASGVTEAYLGEQLRDRGARSVRFVALVDKPDERKTAFEVHHHLLSTRRRGTLVGYGLKHRGRHGNLPYLGLLPEASE